MNPITRRANNLLESLKTPDNKGKSEVLDVRIYRYPETGEYIIGALDKDGKPSPAPKNAACADSLRAIAQLAEVFHQWDKLAPHRR